MAPPNAHSVPLENPVIKREMARINTTDAPFHCVWDESSPCVMLIFNGMPLTESGWVPYQMVRTTIGLPCSKIYLRDTARAWYHQGLKPYTRAIDDTAAFLLQLIVERTHVRRIVAVGPSAGGYTALLIGTLIGADEVHGFGPRTYLDIENRMRYDDYSMEAHLPNVYLYPEAQQEYFDLEPFFQKRQGSPTKIFVHYDDNHALDRTAAEHICSAPNFFRRIYQTGGHQLVRHLRDTDALSTILLDAIHGRTETRDINHAK
ncbi:MAG: hypothetical protein AAF225_10955 [Pseudomonadota bacterium]